MIYEYGNPDHHCCEQGGEIVRERMAEALATNRTRRAARKIGVGDSVAHSSQRTNCTTVKHAQTWRRQFTHAHIYACSITQYSPVKNTGRLTIWITYPTYLRLIKTIRPFLCGADVPVQLTVDRRTSRPKTIANHAT